MSFWGIGKPKIEIISAAGIVLTTYNLPAPQSREFGWPLENDPKVNPVTGHYLERRLGFRPTLRFIYYGANITATVEDLLEMVNAKNSMRVTPHVDIPDINWLAVVTEFTPSHIDGKVNSDRVEIVFTGVHRRESIPNIDTLITISRRNGKLIKDLP